MITDNKVLADLRDLILLALHQYNVMWDVIQTKQETIGYTKAPCILFHRLYTTNYGFQSSKNRENQHIETQIEIQKFKIEAYFERKSTDTVNNLTGSDVIKMIASFFMSENGIKEIINKGYEMLRITQIDNGFYKNVGEVYQVNPNFEIELKVDKEYTTDLNLITEVKHIIKEL